MEIKVTQADKEFAQSVGKRLVEDGFAVGCCNMHRRDGAYLADIIEEDFAVWRIDAQAELIEALEKIARAQCTSVDGRSDDLTDSWHHLKSIAREAIAKAKGGV